MKGLIKYFGDLDIEMLEFSMIRDFKSSLDRTRASETVRNYIVRLRVVLGYLRDRGSNCLPPEQVPIPKRRDKVPVYLSKEQVSECINSTKRVKNKAIVSLLYASGIRVSELCAMNRGDIHEDCFTIIGKGGKARLCFIDERTKIYLALYLETRIDNNTALFLCDGGTRIKPKTIQDTFISIRKQTGYECHPHTMRHSFATNLLETNTNLYHVSRMLGHAQLSTTQQYLHVVDPDLKKVYAEHHTT